MHTLNLLLNFYLWVTIPSLFILGACIGSFLNVVIYRIPANLSLIRPGSRCGHCKTPIPIYLNIPILGWLFLRGKTACCNKPYSVRYPLVEFITGCLAVSLWFLTRNLELTLIYGVLISILLCAFLIDLDTMTIPDCLTLTLPLVLGMGMYALIMNFGSTALPLITPSILGLFIGSGVILWIGMLTSWIINKDALGTGDIKLMGTVGLFLGWQLTVAAMFIGAGITGLFMILGIKPKAVNTEIALPGEFPFGPGLCIGALASLIYGLLCKQEWLPPFLDIINLFK